VLIRFKDVARGEEIAKDLLPVATEVVVPIAPERLDAAVQKLNEVMNSLDVRWLWKPPLSAGMMLARENVWSRAARRKQQRQDAMETSGDGSDDNENKKIALAVKLSVDTQGLLVRWLRGSDAMLLESFTGMLRRTLREAG
jgi:23S rRNA (adenine1618-N6)-methyltransferase